MTGTDDQDHAQLRELLGAYLLGGLSDQDTSRVEQHIAECDDCLAALGRQAPVMDLLRQRRPADEHQPTGRLDTLLAAVRTEREADKPRRVRRWVAATAAGLLLVAGVGLGIAIGRITDTGTGVDMSIAVSPAAGAGVSGEATFTQQPWGTAVSISVRGMPANGPFSLRAHGVRGRIEQAATWGTASNDAIQVTGAISMPIPMVESIAVVDGYGHVIATADLPG